MKAERVQVRDLPPFAPREILSVPVDSLTEIGSEATVYAGLGTRLPAATGTVAVSLVAGLLGHRQEVATVGIPPGFDGIAVIASGICADAWHVEAFGGGSDVSLSVALGVRQCCSGFGVFVPAELAANIPNDPALNIRAARTLPLSRTDGAYLVDSAQASPILLNYPEGFRILRATVTAGIASVNVGFSGSTFFGWSIPAGETQSIEPRGNLSGPLNITTGATAVEYYGFETVR